MAAVIDFRLGRPAPAVPANLEAEAGLIGAVLYDNAIAARLDSLEPRHFHDDTHGRVWAAIQVLVADRQIADAVTVTERLGGGDDLRHTLLDLWDSASPAGAEDYARLIVELSQRRAVIAAANAAIEAASSGAQAAAVIGDLEAGLLALQRGDRRVDLVSAADAVADVLADLDAPEGEQGGILTGIPPIDEHHGPMLPDDLILMAARPGMGKSALAGCVALNVSRAGHGVIEINSEMNHRQMMRRHLVDLCFERWGTDAPTYKDIRRRKVSVGQRRMLQTVSEDISSYPLYMVKRTGLTLSALRALVRRQASIWAGQGVTLGLITVDHVGLLAGDSGGKDRYSDQTAIAIGMKQLADELRVPVIALVQLNRKVEDREHRRPILSDLRDSGAWEENADTVIGIYREAYYANKEPEPKDNGAPAAMLKWQDWDKRRRSKTIEAILLKVREGEETSITLWASIGHNAIRGADPFESGGFL